MARSINVDTKTFIRFWLVLLGFFGLIVLVDRALEGIVIVAAAIFLAIAIKPLGDSLYRLSRKALRTNKIGHRIDAKVNGSRKYSVIAYLIVLVGIAAIIAISAPVVIDQTSKFIAQLPQIFEHTIGGWEGINDFGRSIGMPDLHNQILSAIQAFSSSITSNLGSILMSGIGTIASFLTAAVLTLILTLFFMTEGPTLMENFWQAVGGSKHPSPQSLVARRMVGRMADVISMYVSRQVIVAILDGVVVGITTALLSLIFHFENLAIPLGLISMVLYLIPMFGQVVACAIITILLLSSSPAAAIIFAIFYLIYAQVENNFIAPKLQGKGLGLPPLIVLVAIVLGTYTAGLIGAIIAVPIAGCIKVLIEEYPKLREAREKQPSA